MINNNTQRDREKTLLLMQRSLLFPGSARVSRANASPAWTFGVSPKQSLRKKCTLTRRHRQHARHVRYLNTAATSADGQFVFDKLSKITGKLPALPNRKRPAKQRTMRNSPCPSCPSWLISPPNRWKKNAKLLRCARR